VAGECACRSLGRSSCSVRKRWGRWRCLRAATLTLPLWPFSRAATLLLLVRADKCALHLVAATPFCAFHSLRLPLQHLDLNAVIWLEDYLQKWKSTLLVVSTHQDFLSAVVTDIIHLEARSGPRSRCVTCWLNDRSHTLQDRKLYYYKGNYDDFKEMHKQKVEKQQKDWEKQQKLLKSMKEKGKLEQGRQGQGHRAVEAWRGAIQGRQRQGPQRWRREHGHREGRRGPRRCGRRPHCAPKEYVVTFTFDDPPELARPVLAVSGMGFRYGDKYPWLFKDVNFGIDQSSRIAIVGPNGVGECSVVPSLESPRSTALPLAVSGKSTLLNLMTGEARCEHRRGHPQPLPPCRQVLAALR